MLKDQMRHGFAFVLWAASQWVLSSILIDVAPLEELVVHMALFLWIDLLLEILFQLIVPLFSSFQLLQIDLLLLLLLIFTKQLF